MTGERREEEEKRRKEETNRIERMEGHKRRIGARDGKRRIGAMNEDGERARKVDDRT